MDTTHSHSQTLPNRQVLSISLCDRWQVYQRLQELDIPCTRLEDGRLQAEVNDSLTTILQVWSVVFQLTASRQQIVNWLEQCW
jgi:hypothetical protein